MPIPGILKSKAFWTFSTFTGTVSSCVAYDRYHSHVLRQKYLTEAAEYGRQPLLHHQSPRCISIFLLSKDTTHHKSLRDTFKIFALDILTRAGVDYKWVVEVDGEEAGKWWDDGAREGNNPELMLEDSKKIVDVEVLKEHVLERKLSEMAGIKQPEPESAETTEILWESIRNKSCSTDWPPSSDGFLALDPFTYNSLHSSLKQLADTPVKIDNLPVKKSSWLWSKSSQTPASKLSLNLFPLPLYFIPCEYPQTAFTRLIRFLFGQRHLTRSIGEALLALIREQPKILVFHENK